MMRTQPGTGSLFFIVILFFTSSNAVASLKLINYFPLTVASEFADMETSFFESLNIGPDVFKNTSKSGAADTGTGKYGSSLPSHRDGRASESANVKPIAETKVQTKKTESPDSQTSMEGNMGIWQFFLMALVALVFTAILFLLVRLSKNAKVLETPNNLVNQIKELVKEFDGQNKNIKDVKNRIQKSENTFLKVISSHIDEKHNQMSKEIDMQFQDFLGTNKTLIQQNSTITTKIYEMEGLMSTLKAFVAEQKAELRKMQEGYNWSVINSMCMGLIRIIDKLDEDIKNTSNKDIKTSLNDSRALITAMLETYDVAEISPEVGKAYQDKDKSENIKVTMVKPKKQEKKGTVARVIKPSFIYQGGYEQEKVLRAAEIEVYQ